MLLINLIIHKVFFKVLIVLFGSLVLQILEYLHFLKSLILIQFFLISDIKLHLQDLVNLHKLQTWFSFWILFQCPYSIGSLLFTVLRGYQNICEIPVYFWKIYNLKFLNCSEYFLARHGYLVNLILEWVFFTISF